MEDTWYLQPISYNYLIKYALGIQKSSVNVIMGYHLKDSQAVNDLDDTSVRYCGVHTPSVAYKALANTFGETTANNLGLIVQKGYYWNPNKDFSKAYYLLVIADMFKDDLIKIPLNELLSKPYIELGKHLAVERINGFKYNFQHGIYLQGANKTLQYGNSSPMYIALLRKYKDRLIIQRFQNTVSILTSDLSTATLLEDYKEFPKGIFKCIVRDSDIDKYKTIIEKMAKSRE